ncbi:MAG: transcription-repair coupling factor [Lactobacillus sp.]|nr:transcription-repair coupling factor [Lactobacillus sp.]MDN6053165.1 transcription-repair coupling factor [Lactobacillus sp.]
MKLTDFLTTDQALVTFLSQLKQVKNSLLTGASAGAFSLLIKGLVALNEDPIMLVMPDENKAQTMYAVLNEVLATDQVQLFPVDATLAMQSAVSSPDFLSHRIQALNFLLSGQAGVVVTTPQGLQYPLSPAKQFASSRVLTPGESYPLGELSEWLVAAGYRKENMIARPGEFAIRGDIVDVYPLDRESPIRMEFFGDEIDTIKTMDLSTQRSGAAITSLKLGSALDRVFTLAQLTQAAKLMQADMAKAPAPQKDVLAHFGSALALLSAGSLPDNQAFLVDYLLPEQVSLLSYLAPNGLVLFDDWSLVQQQVLDNSQLNAGFIKEELQTGAMLPGQKLRLDFFYLMAHDAHHRLYYSLFQRTLGRIRLDQMYHWQTRQPQTFFSQMPLVQSELAAYQKRGATVVLQADNAQRAKQMLTTLADFEIKPTLTRDGELLAGRTQLLVGGFAQGFDLPSSQLVYLTERELFNQRPHHRRQVKNIENAQRLRRYSDLKPGDYVVHVNHGIGRFEGIKTLTNQGVKRDYITITYQHGDQLFVPADQLGLVQKYVGSEGKTPKVNKLGGSEWAKTKQRVAATVDDIADDLIELYAKREAEKGYAFSPDNDLQAEFEAAFPYPETPDQLRSIKEVKHDMEQVRPMDRLLVGDVGFGKTEVALRAAFKAIQDDKQVAFLVPTTILAQQHYETIKDRLGQMPVNFAMLSRFQGTAESKEILAKLKNGQLDLVVGTHRILSKDVKFQDLGLLIVDEEQRFGVKHKERLKQLKANIDVLTLTATPIPRTLHMSMIGVRDLSVMETPPRNRYPIQTYVMEQNPSVVKEAIKRELARAGQVFYVHNRIGDIEEVVARLSQLVPAARIAYAHGRMNEHQLEDILYAFLNREYDVLVTTTIIETGIDMPNVNTMIIEDADRYGLSQLYQLRGRIGRSARLAYAYFLYQPNKVLTETGEKRLDAIRDFTELGSGFKIAMSDLAIRGAGNMLGAQQHGFVDSVGYDLYSQMLKDALQARKGKKVVKHGNAELDLKLEAYIPDAYIPDQAAKIGFYKKIKAAQSDDELTKLGDELLDRFGDYPVAVEHLLQVSALKLLADAAEVKVMTRTGTSLKIVFTAAGTTELKGPNVFKAMAHVAFKARISLNQLQELVVVFQLADAKNRVVFNEMSTFLTSASEILTR